MDILNASLKELTTALDEKKISSVELTKFYLDRIEKYDPKVKAYLHVNKDGAMKDAATQDEKRKNGTHSQYAGIPIALKDLILTKDMPTTCASKFLQGYYSPFEGAVVNNLRNAGFVFLGKLNMDEFAMGSSGETSYYQKTANPWDLTKVPGGSSSGSAAATAARLAPVTLGSDTGGSIRQPAALCGVTGYKPSYGTISRNGVVAYASSLDQVGTISTSVEDAAMVVDVISATDDKDSMYNHDIKRGQFKNLNPNIKGMKLGLPSSYLSEELAPEIVEKLQQALDVYRSLGAEIVEIDMPHGNMGLTAYQIISNAEAASNLSRFDGIEFGYRANTKNLDELYSLSRGEAFGSEVKRRIIFGTYVLQTKQYQRLYVKAMKIRQLICQDYTNAFKKCDIIVGPTSATTAFEFGGKTRSQIEMHLNDLYTVMLNLYGSCGISVPCGFDNKNLPIGLQLQGDRYADQKLLNIAYAYQMATDWHKKIPTL